MSKKYKKKKKICGEKKVATGRGTVDSPADVLSSSSAPPKRLKTLTGGATEFVVGFCAISGLRAGLCVLLNRA